ncbi:MAG: hypothetical protein E7323_09480 [Clostridiales bacterium]|nr:hypothetical protein [Clostridiales bacterium]
MWKTIRKWFCQKKDTPETSAQPASEPFAFAGWPDYINPEWPEGYQRTQGISFEIGKGCFGKKDPLLFYRDYGRGIEDEKLYAETIEKYSSGIRVAEVKSHCPGGYDSGFTFRLDQAAGSGQYVLMVPVSGEFQCELGQVVDGDWVPMCKEHFLADSLYALQMDLRHSEMDAPHDYRPQMKNIRF